MQIVTVNLPSIYIDVIAKLCEQGLFPSRSETIRQALRDFLKVELGMVASLLDLKDEPSPSLAIEGHPEQKPSPKKIDMRSIRTGWS